MYLQLSLSKAGPGLEFIHLNVAVSLTLTPAGGQCEPVVASNLRDPGAGGLRFVSVRAWDTVSGAKLVIGTDHHQPGPFEVYDELEERSFNILKA